MTRRALEIPYDASELMHLSRRERVLYEAVIAAARITGAWSHPAARNGDLEEMQLLDKIYWVHKARHPIEVPPRGSSLERLFASSAAHRWALPPGFRGERAIAVRAVGDLFCHPWLGRSRGHLYSAIADDLFGADLSMGNLECVIAPDEPTELAMTTRRSTNLSFDGPSWESIRGHEGRAFDFLAMANNHTLDLGADGIDRCLEILDEGRVAHHGANRTEDDARRARVLERSGIRVGVVSWTFGLNARRPPPDRPWVVNRTRLNGRVDEVDLRGLDVQVEHAREAGCSFVVAQLHWGMEHERYPTPDQVALAHALAERGVDAIVGHHPHLVQPLEAYRTRRDPARVVPIFYSLGNLTSAFRAPFLCRGGLGKLRLVAGEAADGSARTYVAEASLHGIRQDADEGARRLRLVPTGPLGPAGR